MKDEEFLENTTAVIPASGFSKRMGREKLLLPFRGKSILANVLEAVCSFSWKRVIVCAAQEDVINEARKKADVHVLYNPDPSAGQSRSIILAVEESAQSAGWIFTSADMPLLSKEIIRRLREAIASHPDQIVQVRYQGLPGQPVYFPGKYREELLHLTGDTGGRQIIHRHLACCCSVQTDTATATFALDDVSFKAFAIVYVENLHLLTLNHTCGIHQILVDGDAANIVKVSLRNSYAVNLRFKYLDKHSIVI
jgi:molybdenum cofactor cytidylyltransferase